MSFLKQAEFKVVEYHYIYKVTDTLTGEYYIGVRSCNVEPEKDPYMGSGISIRNLAKEIAGLKKVPNSALSSYFKKSNSRVIKEIIEVCGSRGEAFTREEYHVGDKWKCDEKCRNLVRGGDGSGCGEDSPRYDPAVYHLWDHNEGKEVFYTTNELSKIGVQISLLKSGRLVHQKGISLYENRNKDIRVMLSDEKHHLWDHNEGKEVFYTTNELYKIGIAISTLKYGVQVHCKGISLYENRDKDIRFLLSDEKHHLWDHNEGKEVFYTTNELWKKYGVSISKLKSGDRIHQKGISLYENRHAKVRLHKTRKPKVA